MYKKRFMGRSRPKNRRKKLNLVLESAPMRKKRKGLFQSPGSLSGVILIAIFVSVIGVSLFALSKSVTALFVEDPRFALSRIDVSNVRIFTPDEIVALSGIPLGVNIFSVDLAEAKKRIEDNPNIKRADLSRAFPDSVQVRVYEREPVAILDVGKNYLVDEDAVLLSWDGRWNVKELPLITGAESGAKFVDKRIASDNVAEAIRIVRLYGSSRIGTSLRITKVDVTNTEDIVCQTDADFICRLSRGCGPEKFEQLLLVFRDLKAKGTEPAVVDLRFSDAVVTPKAAKDLKQKT